MADFGVFRMAGIATPSTEYIADSEPESPALLCTLRYNILVPRPGMENDIPKSVGNDFSSGVALWTIYFSRCVNTI